jgi:isocitrate dehydrogenase (NAD+)
MFGDIVSDAFAGLVGGLGFACLGQHRRRRSRCSSPPTAPLPSTSTLDPPIVNPIAMILSAAMLLDHIGEREKADRIRAAVAAVVKEGKVRTYDMLKMTGGPGVVEKGAATSSQVTDAIIEKLG